MPFPGPTIAPIGPVIRARRRILSKLEAAGAIDSETAIPFEPSGLNQRRALSRLRAGGIVFEPQPGRYFVEPEAAEQWRRAVRTRSTVLIGTALAAAAAVFAISR
jgi:hypothetical protein